MGHKEGGLAWPHVFSSRAIDLLLRLPPLSAGLEIFLIYPFFLILAFQRSFALKKHSVAKYKGESCYAS